MNAICLSDECESMSYEDKSVTKLFDVEEENGCKDQWISAQVSHQFCIKNQRNQEMISCTAEQYCAIETDVKYVRLFSAQRAWNRCQKHGNSSSKMFVFARFCACYYFV